MKIFDAIAAEPGPFFIVGSNKNAGKTTLLNRLNKELTQRLSTPPGLATIGRDGETEDIIWRHPKPPVFLNTGNCFVTVEPELKKIVGEAEAVETLPFRTALGPVVVGRAIQSTQVELIGPDTNQQLWQAIDHLHACGATHQLIDGAYDRRTQVASHDGARLALVLSADIAKDEQQAADWLTRQIEWFALPPAPPELRPTDEKPLGLHDLNGQALFCSGPLTDTLAEQHFDRLAQLPLIIEDATKVFLSPLWWRRLKRKSPGVYVLHRQRLLLIASNPKGLLREFDPQTFFDTLKQAAPHLPLIDVEAGLEYQPPAS